MDQSIATVELRLFFLSGLSWYENMGLPCKEKNVAHGIETTELEKLAISFPEWISSFNHSVNFTLFIKLQLSVRNLAEIGLTFDGW